MASVLLLSVMTLVAITDTKNRTIPNKIIVPAICLALFFQIIHLNFTNIKLATGVFLVLVLLYMISPNFIPGGDVKLFTFMTLILGEQMREFLYPMALSTMLVIAILFIKQIKTKERQTVPYGLSSFLAIVLMYVVGSLKI